MSYEVVFYPKAPGQKRRYEIDGESVFNGHEVKSVTEILSEIGDKFGVAAWYGQGTGLVGAQHLCSVDSERFQSATKDELAKWLTAEKLTVNHVRDAAGSRGTSVHKAGEDWAEGADFWPPDFPETERGYCEALHAFILEKNPTPLASEVQVGSKNYAYAGTFDLLAEIHGEFWLLDYKTSKGVYPTMHLQLTAYEMARREMGHHPPTQHQGIVHLKPDGEYELVENKSTPEQWFDCLSAYRALMGLKDSLKKPRRKRVAA